MTTEEYNAKARAYRAAHKEEINSHRRAYRAAHRVDWFKQYCAHPEDIENYELAKADNFLGWDVHHRLETHNSDGVRRLVDLTMDELIALGMYYARPPEELIFIRHKDHISLHKKGRKQRGHPCSVESRAKISAAQKRRWSK